MVARLEACEVQALVQRGCGSGSHVAKAVESYIVSRDGEGACEVARGADVVGQGLSSHSTAATVGASKHALKVLGFASLARKLRLVILILTAAKVSSQQPVRCDTRGSGSRRGVWTDWRAETERRLHSPRGLASGGLRLRHSQHASSGDTDDARIGFCDPLTIGPTALSHGGTHR